MKPQDQEFLHKPEIGQYGDCQRAVIASLLELQIHEVPHFLQLSKGDPSDFWNRIQAFCKQYNYFYLTVQRLAGSIFFGEGVNVYHEISGPSPRDNNVHHAVIGLNGQIVFDPHPSRAGLAGDPYGWQYSYLVFTSDKKD